MWVVAGVVYCVVLNFFPYPVDEGNETELDRFNRIEGHGEEKDFRTVRHRADAMFGQLFELNNVSDATLAALDAFFGAVRVQTLAQIIHYARWGLLAGCIGSGSTTTG